MKKLIQLFIILSFISLIGCIPNKQTEDKISVNLLVDGQSISTNVILGTNVQQVIDENHVILNNLDRVEPPSYTVILKETQIRVVRVVESFVTSDILVPFDHQTVQNESLSEGQTLLIQAGENGNQQIVYRVVSEDGKEISRTVYSQITLKSEIPEIIMVGMKAISKPTSIPGKLAYIVAGNAWMMEETTGNRIPLVTTGDLDGYIFSISSNGQWLLFSRKAASKEQGINSLWVVNTSSTQSKPIDLSVSNVIRSAQWIPDHPLMLTYSTVEPRSAAPGWQANNDLWQMTLNDDGTPLKKEKLLDSNSGGLYGWWGIQFVWSRDGRSLAYSLPDQIGVVDFEGKKLINLLPIVPLNTQGDWAWLPSLAWSPDNRILFIVHHASQDPNIDPEDSQSFNLVAFDVRNQRIITLVPNVGMFANPFPANQENLLHTRIGYFTAIFPDQSATSRYRFALMDQDGSNQQLVFPSESATGMEPGIIAWSPKDGLFQTSQIALLYKGNLFFLDSVSLITTQITGDGLISTIDWK
jgi:hypothetical protein